MEMHGNIAALLSHQLEQLFKLDSSLRAEKGEVDLLSHEVRDLEMKWNRKSIKTPAHQLEVEVDKLETDITNLRGECDIMSERVTDLTGGKVPLGETSVNFTDFLHKPAGDNTDGPLVAEPMETETPAPSDLVAGEGGKWNCSQCTFANHPQLDTCEICNMPKIKTGSGGRCSLHNHTQEFVSGPENRQKIFSGSKLRKPGLSPAARITNKHNDQSSAGKYVLEPAVASFGQSQGSTNRDILGNDTTSDVVSGANFSEKSTELTLVNTANLTNNLDDSS